MAEMVPDRMPTRASQGEKRLFAILQQLPDDYIVYYEPIDEAQDFDPSWFRCTLAALAEPYDGDLIIVGDGSQGL